MSAGDVYLFRVRGNRAHRRGRETITGLRRRRDAAIRLADQWTSMGRGPVTIEVVTITPAQWQEVEW